MLEGLFRIHLGAFRYGANATDRAKTSHRDSPSPQTALSSCQSNQGERENAT